MDGSDRFELVQRITELEGELAAIKFPANGSLYLCGSLAEGETRVTLSPDVDPSGQFCIGSSCERQWMPQAGGEIEFSESGLDHGPCKMAV